MDYVKLLWLIRWFVKSKMAGAQTHFYLDNMDSIPLTFF